MFLTKTFVVKDASYYNSNTVTTSIELNNLNLPTNFKATYKLNRATSKVGWIEIGQNSTNLIFFGVDSGSGAIGIYVKVNGSYETYQRNSSAIVSPNTDTLIEYSNNNGVQTLKVNGTTVNLTNSTISSRNYLRYNTDSGTSSIKELLIMPL